MKIEERKNLSKFTSEKKAKILIHRVKIATKETLEIINEVIYAGACVVTV